MATVSLALPRARRRTRNEPAAGRASFPEIYFVKHIDNSRLRREVDLEKRRECYGLLVMGILVFLFGLLIARQHFQCVRNGYEIEQLKSEQATFEQWNRQLRLEKASLADPQRIDTLARRDLGLVSPRPQQVIQMGGAAGATSAESPQLARNFSMESGGAPRVR
ncbi:MAG: cell division protein FtsL [Acidobacteriia bacterium]|nr:cell division protein FtsL [Terriglobia bacterium]